MNNNILNVFYPINKQYYYQKYHIDSLPFSINNSIMKEKRKRYNYMSIMALYKTNKGVVLISDSRELHLDGRITDDKIKLFSNDDIIVGSMGVDYVNDIQVAKLLTDELLKTKDINHLREYAKKFMNVIPDNLATDIFYATKDGDYGVLEVMNDNIYLFNDKEFFYYSNGLQFIKDFFDFKTLNLSKPEVNSTISLNEAKDKLINAYNNLLEVENKKEKEDLEYFSPVGGEIQIKILEFKK